MRFRTTVILAILLGLIIRGVSFNHSVSIENEVNDYISVACTDASNRDYDMSVYNVEQALKVDSKNQNLIDLNAEYTEDLANWKKFMAKASSAFVLNYSATNEFGLSKVKVKVGMTKEDCMRELFFPKSISNVTMWDVILKRTVLYETWIFSDGTNVFFKDNSVLFVD